MNYLLFGSTLYIRNIRADFFFNFYCEWENLLQEIFIPLLREDKIAGSA